jgi:NADH-quinone oxidoreductase subunit J
MTFEMIGFAVLAVGSIGTAILMITRRNPMVSVLFLIANFFFLAVIYLTLHAQFIAVIQILVYAGAIMVLFLFVIMLLNLGDDRQLRETAVNKKSILAGLVFAVIVQFVVPIVTMTEGFREGLHAKSEDIGTVESVGRELFSRFVFPFEVVSILLLAAIVGAVVLAKRRFR